VLALALAPMLLPALKPATYGLPSQQTLPQNAYARSG
jgi:hypothetical protein